MFGFKQWNLVCEVSEYWYQMDLYVGKQVNCLDDPKNHEIYVDNFFSSYALFAEMRPLGMRITGKLCSTKYQMSSEGQ